MQHDVVVLIGDEFEAGKRRLLARRARGRHDDGRHERERVDCAVEVFLLAVLRAHDDDESHVAHGIERLSRPGKNRLSSDFNELLAALVAKALARAARQDDSRRLRFGVDNALKPAHRLRKRVEVEVIELRIRHVEH